MIEKFFYRRKNGAYAGLLWLQADNDLRHKRMFGTLPDRVALNRALKCFTWLRN